MGNDTAAAIAQITLPPSRWEHVTFTPAPNGAPWTMTVRFTGTAYPQQVEIPGGSAAQEVLKMLKDPLSVGVKERSAWDPWIDNDRDFDVEGTV